MRHSQCSAQGGAQKSTRSRHIWHPKTTPSKSEFNARKLPQRNLLPRAQPAPRPTVRPNPNNGKGLKTFLTVTSCDAQSTRKGRQRLAARRNPNILQHVECLNIQSTPSAGLWRTLPLISAATASCASPRRLQSAPPHQGRDPTPRHTPAGGHRPS